ncbi:MAG: hypothetical protein SPG88_08315 [Enterococcus hirae]|uniref:hypothetical protein n=1 Tax=Enterococcus hirae TaxID=1354 RepID=UPI000557C3CE|nr:hypothetical protein [Enterococcus hirae]KNB98391.1 hypothetical protein LK32_01775 [Enterococcus hirae]MCI5921603.1 hypothetical protein [Enterococcus hirae]MDY5310085.1 hypothetical protein [Enterococcus hirae]
MNGFIKKVNQLEEAEQINFYLNLQRDLLKVFAKDIYNHQEQLQNDFQRFKESNLYEPVLKYFCEKCYTNLSLEVTDFEKLNKKRFKLCKVCGNPLLSCDRMNGINFCYEPNYVRYTIEKQRFFRSSKQASQCQMKRKSQLTIEYNNRKKMKQ